jgi:ABC-type transporter Mla subunit MlaD
LMVSSRQDLLREVASLVARLAEDSQKAADLIKQAADMMETVAELLSLDDPDVRVH